MLIGLAGIIAMIPLSGAADQKIDALLSCAGIAQAQVCTISHDEADPVKLELLREAVEKASRWQWW